MAPGEATTAGPANAYRRKPSEPSPHVVVPNYRERETESGEHRASGDRGSRDGRCVSVP
jgi:hypothetical protein